MHDVKLTFINRSNSIRNASIVLFQEEPSPDPEGKHYPLAWKVFPLKGPEQDVLRTGSVVYTAAQTLSITRTPQPGDPVPYGKLDISRTVQPGDKVVFSIDEYGALSLALLNDKNDAPVIVCANNSRELMHASLVNSGSPIATIVAGPQTTVMFRYSTKLYVACMTTIEEDGASRMVLSSAPVYELDLVHSTEITVTLQDADDDKQEWHVERS